MTSDPSRVLLFFIDGLGIGSPTHTNPFFGLENAEPLAIFENGLHSTILDGRIVPTDACLGVAGRPQSASGQTTILTGVNAPAQLGYHKQGFPNQALLDILARESLFLKLLNAGVKPITFANAYTPTFFADRPRWISATTAAVEAAALPFRTIDDLRANRAVYQDYTNAVLLERGINVQVRTAEEAASVLSGIVSENRFTLYEYFITDKIGHLQDFAQARIVLGQLAQLIRALLTRLDLRTTTVLLTSDHGNIEDLSSRNHTINAVPTIIWGANRQQIATRVRTLADITPVIVDQLATTR